MVNSTMSFENLTADEQIAVTQLKSRMVDCMSEEMYSDLSVFVRFLRARNLNVNAAETMLRNHLEWRKIFQVDAILTDYTPKEAAKKYVTMDSLGFDKDGSPILYFHIGCVDSRGLLKSCRKFDIVKYIVCVLEENVAAMRKHSIKLNKNIDRWTMIVNFTNFSLFLATHKETLEVLGQLISIYEANYPDRLKTAYFINASLYFSMAFSVLKHLFAEQTLKKINVYGNDGWLDDLLSLVPKNVLPKFLGGTRTDPDGNPMCKTIITFGGPVDERYYLNNKEHSVANLPNAKKLIVTRMSKIQVPLNVGEPDSYIEWEFETKNRDIGFSLLYKENDHDPDIQELIPKQRIDAYMTAETGTMKCKNTGIYIMEFDNTFSWFFRKEIYYRVSVVKK